MISNVDISFIPRRRAQLIMEVWKAQGRDKAQAFFTEKAIQWNSSSEELKQIKEELKKIKK